LPKRIKLGDSAKVIGNIQWDLEYLNVKVDHVIVTVKVFAEMMKGEPVLIDVRGDV
jgi:hypothetical protein